MIGQKIGKWLVLSDIKVIQSTNAKFKYYNCQCECGNIKPVRSTDLKNGRSTQCRSCRDLNMHIDINSYVNQKFGKWLVLKPVDTNIKKQRALLCQCECGFEKIIIASRLKLEKTKSCHLCNVTKHGMVKSETYNTWRCMKARCNREGNDNYKHYGAKGITVCKQWLKFQNFLNDMGERPKGLQLDRINNNLGYFKENCRWVTPKENSNNKSNNKKSSS